MCIIPAKSNELFSSNITFHYYSVIAFFRLCERNQETNATMKYDHFLVALVKFMQTVHVKLLHPGSILITILEKTLSVPLDCIIAL